MKLINYCHPKIVTENWDQYREQRGHIKTEDGAWVARPFDKFFNYGQPEADPIDLDEPVLAFDKLDGSLGIGWIHPETGKFTISTKRGWDTEIARYATGVLLPQALDWEPAEGLTYMFEIIYPANRIVLDYGGYAGLVLLAVRENETGAYRYGRQGGWNGDVVEQLPYRTLREALLAPDRQNAEGMVCATPDGRRVKIKQEDYLRLHRAKSHLSKRSVWERLMQGENPLTDLPDELYAEANALVEEVWNDYHTVLYEAFSTYWPLRHLDRKAFAEAVKDAPYRNIVFRMHSQQDVQRDIMKEIKP